MSHFYVVSRTPSVTWVAERHVHMSPKHAREQFQTYAEDPFTDKVTITGPGEIDQHTTYKMVTIMNPPTVK